MSKVSKGTLGKARATHRFLVDTYFVHACHTSVDDNKFRRRCFKRAVTAVCAVLAIQSIPPVCGINSPVQ